MKEANRQSCWDHLFEDQQLSKFRSQNPVAFMNCLLKGFSDKWVATYEVHHFISYKIFKQVIFEKLKALDCREWLTWKKCTIDAFAEEWLKNFCEKFLEDWTHSSMSDDLSTS